MQLSEHEMRQLCLTARDIFMSQPNLLELEAPIKICGEDPCCMHNEGLMIRAICLTHQKCV